MLFVHLLYSPFIFRDKVIFKCKDGLNMKYYYHRIVWYLREPLKRCRNIWLG